MLKRLQLLGHSVNTANENNDYPSCPEFQDNSLLEFIALSANAVKRITETI